MCVCVCVCVCVLVSVDLSVISEGLKIVESQKGSRLAWRGVQAAIQMQESECGRECPYGGATL